MLKKLLLLLLAPCAAPAATLVPAAGQEAVTPRAEIVENASCSDHSTEKKSCFSDLTKRYFSPVARVIGGLRESLSSPVVIELEEELPGSVQVLVLAQDLPRIFFQSLREQEVSDSVYRLYASSLDAYTHTVRLVI